MRLLRASQGRDAWSLSWFTSCFLWPLRPDNLLKNKPFLYRTVRQPRPCHNFMLWLVAIYHVYFSRATLVFLPGLPFEILIDVQNRKRFQLISLLRTLLYEHEHRYRKNTKPRLASVAHISPRFDKTSSYMESHRAHERLCLFSRPSLQHQT